MTLSRDLLLLEIVVLVLQETTAYSDTWRTMEYNTNGVPSQEIKREGPARQTTSTSGSDGTKIRQLTPQEKNAFTQLLSAAGVRMPQPADTPKRQDRQDDAEEGDSDWNRPFGITIRDSDASPNSKHDHISLNFGHNRRPRKPANTPASVTTDWMNTGNNPESIRKILDRAVDAPLNEKQNNFEETLPHDRRPKRHHYHYQRSQDREGHGERHGGHRYRHYHENKDRYNSYEDRDRYYSDEDRDRYYSDEDGDDYYSDEDGSGYYSDEDRGRYGSDEDEDRAYNEHSNHMPQRMQKRQPVRQSRGKKHLINIDLNKMIGGGIKDMVSSVFNSDSIFGSFGKDGTAKGPTKTGMQASDRSGSSMTDVFKKLASKGEQLVKALQSWKRKDDTWGKGTAVDDSQDFDRVEDDNSNDNDDSDYDDTDDDRDEDEENDEEEKEEDEEESGKEGDEKEDKEKSEKKGDEEENEKKGKNDKEDEEEEEEDTDNEEDEEENEVEGKKDKEDEEEEEDDTGKKQNDDDEEEEDKNKEGEDENEKEEDEGEGANEGEAENEEEEEEEDGDNAYDRDRSGFESDEDSDMSSEDKDFDDEDRYFHYEDRDLDYGDIYFDYEDSDVDSHENYFDFEEQAKNGMHYKSTGSKKKDTNSENRKVAHSDNGIAKVMAKGENQNSNKDRKDDEEAVNALKWLTKSYTPLHSKLFEIGAKTGFQDRMLVAPPLPLPDNTVEEGIIGPDGSFHTELVTYFRRRR